MTRITFERTGGLMGRKISFHLDLDSLPPEQAEIISHLLEESHFFSLPEDLEADAIPDGFTYVITAETEFESKVVRVSDTSAPEPLRPLLIELSRSARTRPAPK